MPGPRAFCRGGQVRRRHAICGMCRVPRARRARAPDASTSDCCERVTCHGHALDWRGSPRTTASPRRVCACVLASRDLSSAKQTCHVCASAALRLPPMRRIESDIRWQRPVQDGRLHSITPLHGDAGCSAASPFRAKRELQSHTCSVFHSPACCGCVDQFAARGSRSSPAPDACLRAHQNVGSHDFCRCAHGQRVQEEGNN